MTSSEKTELLCEALVKFQGCVDGISRTQHGQIGTRQYSYADLATVIAAIKPGLAEAGLAVIQTFAPSCEWPVANGERKQAAMPPDVLAVLKTRVIHRSGQWIESTIPVVTDWRDPQKLGSTTTYLRRYALLAILSLAAEDDDGAAASRRVASGERRAGGVNPLSDVCCPGQGADAPRSPVAARWSPADGVDLFGKARDRDRKRGNNDMLHFLKQVGRDRRWPDRVVQWTSEQALEAWELAKQHFGGGVRRPTPITNGATECNGNGNGAK